MTSVSKKPEKQWRGAAAIYVITREAIRRSGVTSLAEALRLAPGVQVARINSNQWAVGIRGFASNLSRSVLVLIDGRSVYTPLFAGTYWQAQDTLLEDVDRIEVIRGPGGALWGANAVDGVINIITRSSRDTEGMVATGGGGTQERGFGALRYGGRSGDSFTYRAYAKAFDRAAEFHADNNNFDSWHMEQGGFRADWTPNPGGTLTVQGDIYANTFGEQTALTTLVPPFSRIAQGDAHLSGGNVLAHWRFGSPGGTSWDLQGYYDRTNHNELAFREGRNTLDIDIQRHAAYGRHDLIVGAAYRHNSSGVASVPTISFTPADRTDELFSGFARDELSLFGDTLVAALGVKLEHNDYTGFEFQPSAQLLWAPTPRQSLWASLERAVRTPSRIETDLVDTVLLDPRAPSFARIVTNPGFKSERILAIQVGYRLQPTHRATIDATVFHNNHSMLESAEPGTPFVGTSPPAGLVIPFSLGNGIGGESYGAEIAADWTPFDRWRIASSYSFLRLDLSRSPGSLDTSTAASTNGSAPRHMAQIQSRLDFFSYATFDATLRYVGALPARLIPSYVTLDSRVGLHLGPRLEISVAGANLLSARHAEFPGGSVLSVIEVSRSVFGAITWRR